MVNLRQIVFSLFASHLPTHDGGINSASNSKSIAIVGAGSAGLAMLKTLLDLPEETRGGWDIVLYEQRENVGGIWLPDPNPTPPPDLPSTPLYPRLHTNTPVPSMSYPGFPFPEGTALYPSHVSVELYHQEYAKHFNLTPHIRYNHAVLASSWVGNSAAGYWNVTIRDGKEKVGYKPFDHLVVASGNNHFPRIPSWPGQEEWLANSPAKGRRREIIHSIWYREPKKYVNCSVVVVGTGASGNDIASQVVQIARKTYVSARSPPDPLYGPIPRGVDLKPGISHFTADRIVFQDGTTCDADSVILGTGYELRIPFLEEGNALTTDPSAHSNTTYTLGLVTNLRYLFPLHQHVISLCPSYPLNALSFIGLPIFIANCPSDIAQSLYVTHAIVNSSLLPSREELLADLATQEEDLRRRGYDPYHIGHRLVDGSSSDYQDGLVDYLKKTGAIPDDGKKYVESWRRELLEFSYLKSGWKHVEELGTQAAWLKSVRTEEDWADLMRRLNRWQADWEREHARSTVPRPQGV